MAIVKRKPAAQWFHDNIFLPKCEIGLRNLDLEELVNKAQTARDNLRSALRQVDDDFRDDTVYRLTGDDIDQVAEEMGEKLTEAEVAHVQKGIDAGFGNCWHDIVESAIQDVVTSRRES